MEHRTVPYGERERERWGGRKEKWRLYVYMGRRDTQYSHTAPPSPPVSFYTLRFFSLPPCLSHYLHTVRRADTSPSHIRPPLFLSPSPSLSLSLSPHALLCGERERESGGLVVERERRQFLFKHKIKLYFLQEPSHFVKPY